MLRTIILVSAGLAIVLIAVVVFALATPGAASPGVPADALGASISAAAPAPVVQPAVPSIDAYHGPGGGYAGRVELVSPVVIEQQAGDWTQFSTPFAKGVWAPSAALDAVLGQEPQGGALEELPVLEQAAAPGAPAAPVQAAAAPAPAPAPQPPVVSPLEPLAELAAAPTEPASHLAPLPAGSAPGWYAEPANGCDSASPPIVCVPPTHGSAPKPETKP